MRDDNPIGSSGLPEPAAATHAESCRVLVVDDSAAQRTLLASSLRKLGYEVLLAESGAAGLEICRAEPVDIVISDWMMPGMDGLAFCRRFRALDRAAYGYFILLTAKGEKDEIADGLDAGADDFLTKPVPLNELRARLSAGARILAMERQLSEKNRTLNVTLAQLRELYESLDRDLEQARVLQESLVPERFRRYGSTDVSLFTRPCGKVGGDLVGMFSPDPGGIGVYSIDVSGHGVSAAMMTARLRGYLSGRSHEQNLALEHGGPGTYELREPADVARRLNELLLSELGADLYFTMLYAAVEPESGRVRMVQAGHPHPLLQRADGGVVALGPGGPPIGLLPDRVFEGFEATLGPGDRLLFYSDGLTEARDADGLMLEEAGLIDLLSQRRALDGPALLDDLFATISTRSGDADLDDDVSAALLEYAGPESKTARQNRY